MSWDSSLNPNNVRTSSNSLRIFFLVASGILLTLSKLMDTGPSKSFVDIDSFTISSIALSHSGNKASVLYLETRSASVLIPPYMSIN